MNLQIPSAQLQEALVRLRQGDVVGMPTETVYGLAAAIDCEAGLQRIFSIKERPLFDPLIVHVADIDMAKPLARAWNATVQALAERFWPGPLTLVVPKAQQVSDLITSGLDSVGLRCPAHPMARQLIGELGVALAAPSANKFGKTSPTTADHVRDEFGDSVLVIDGGPCDVGIESTVLAVGENSIEILRPGKVGPVELTRALRENGLENVKVLVATKPAVASPGHLETHYMPAKPLVLVTGGDIDQQLKQAERKLGLSNDKARELELPERPELASRTLYAHMRSLAAEDISFMYVIRGGEKEQGFWQAIWNRLEKAATLKL